MFRRLSLSLFHMYLNFFFIIYHPLPSQNNYLPSLSPWAPKSFSPYLHIHISHIPFTLLLTLLANHDSWMIFIRHFVLHGWWYNIFLLHLHGPLHLFAPSFSLHYGHARTQLLSFNITQRGCQEEQHQGRRKWQRQHSCSKERPLSISKQDLQCQRTWSPQWSKSHFKQVNSVVEERRSTRMNMERKVLLPTMVYGFHIFLNFFFSPFFGFCFCPFAKDYFGFLRLQGGLI